MQQYIQSGLPDIIVGKGQDLATYSSRKILAPITGKPYLKNVLADAVKSATFNGTTYGVEFNALYQGVYYNRKIFKDNNLSIPKTQADLQALITKLNSLGITPFATHFLDLWSIGNITMQFAINDIFSKTPGWANEFRAGKISYADLTGCEGHLQLRQAPLSTTRGRTRPSPWSRPRPTPAWSRARPP